jgi:hypothetical protein
MTNAASTASKLTAEARTALINVGTNRQGARVLQPGVSPATFVELVEWGLIGPNDGLTRAGAIVRQRLMDLALESAFG